ncbi:MAG: polysaccharide biosynthesis protein, partial [Bacteroidetes bacterium]|nr:polysaccharide biosynthesis protein [Bacteroidota bacterium]
AWGGEIYVPKIPSFKITDLAEAIAPGAEQKIIGIRPGEKIHEVMITENDSLNTIEFDKYYVLMPPSHFWDDKEMIKEFNGKPVEIGFKYDSLTNTSWLSVEELRTAIKENVDSSFSV